MKIRPTGMNYRNLVELHRLQAEQLGPRPALRFKRHGLYHDISWNTYREQALACASALVDVGVAPGERVGLVAENRSEWLIADLAIMAAAAVNVPPHAPLATRQIHYQLVDADVRWLFVSTAEQLAKVRSIRGELPGLRGVIVFDRMSATEDAISWSGFLQRGRLLLEKHRSELERREIRLGRDDLATIMYTSGTTGNPKGVMLTHGNLLWNAWAVNEAWPRPADGVILNWLPFSHIFARTVDHYLGILAGVEMCLADSVDTLILNLAETQPTHLASVPRFYEKVLAACAGPDPEARGKKLRAIFGPRIIWLNSGGAPLPLSVSQAYHDAGLLLLQGYGLTECAPVISFNSPGAYKLDTVGRPIPTVEVKIAADGEILTRGPHVMPGYWKNPQATAETFQDGWLCTGDLGNLDDAGFLKITGRKKELLVLSSGKKIVPTHIEGLLLGEPCIDQAVVHGEGRNFLSALIVPNWPNLRLTLKASGSTKWEDPSEVLTHDAEVKDLLASRIEKVLIDVSPWERVKEFVVLTEPFSVAREELTVSLKLRRQVIAEHHKEELERLYK
ncbi:MAG: long-chain fatty acid--CoA ligase [Planctomycetes bacterium]|nr:long-chain fatty acid--CoA ligase [Planctomycetota bacterium]